MRKITCAILIGPDDNRYSNAYRFYASMIPGDFKPGEFFSVEWLPLKDEDKVLVILNREEGRWEGVNQVDKKGRLNFTPPEWVFPKVERIQKRDYGDFEVAGFDFGPEVEQQEDPAEDEDEEDGGEE